MLIIFFQQLQCCFQLQLQFVQDERAKCLDGTLGSYYFQQGFEGGQNKFIIYFEGGEFILGNTEEQFLMNAVQKFKYEFNQGPKLSKEVHQIELALLSLMEYYLRMKQTITISIIGIQSILIIVTELASKGINLIKLITNQTYCILEANQQQEAFLTTLYQIFKKLKQQYYRVVQLEELQPCNGNNNYMQFRVYFSSLIPENISILCVSDSGILYDMQSMNGSNLLQQSLKIMNYFANNETQVPQKNCAYDFPNQNWKCFYFQNLMHYIQQPVFIIQPFYDISFLYKYLEIKCIQDLTLNNCQKNEMNFIDHVFQTFRQVIIESLNNNSNTGSFAPSCIADCLFISQLSFSPNWTVPEGSNRTVYQTLVRWVENQKYNSYCQIDFGLMDQQPWPKNSACAGLSSSINLIKLINMILWIIIILL